MKVCVIGGGGFIGRRVVRLLAERDHEVTSLDIQRPDFDGDSEKLNSRVTSARMDITQFEDVLLALRNSKPEAVINLAYNLGDHLPRKAMKLNILGMDNCFEAARLCDVGRVVFASSIAIHGNQRDYGDRKIREDDIVNPDSGQYPAHKLFNEYQASDYRKRHGMSIVAVRAANVSGFDKIGGSTDHVKCIVGPALGQKVRFPFKDQMRCVVYCDDVAEMFVRIALSDKPRHHIYNTGGETLSLGQIAEMVKKTIPDADIAFDQDEGGRARSRGHMFDNTRVTEEFGIKLKPFEGRVAEMIGQARRMAGPKN